MLSTVDPLYTDTRYNNTFHYNDNLPGTKSSPVHQKLCKDVVFNTARNKGDSNKYPDICSMRNKNKNETKPSLHINLLINDSLQYQIHSNGNIFGNRCCHCNKSPLYFINVVCL